MELQKTQIIGPIISVGSITRQTDYFRKGFDLAPGPQRVHDRDFVAQLWGIRPTEAVTRWLAARETPFCILLVQFNLADQRVIRGPGQGVDRDAFKVIDFYTSDLDAAIKQLSKSGFKPANRPVNYQFDGYDFTEFQVYGEDGVICALLSGPEEFFQRFVTNSWGLFSEPIAVSAPVTDRQAALDFWGDLFGFDVGFEFDLKSADLAEMIGAGDGFAMNGINLGPNMREPLIGLLDYGPLRDKGRSILTGSLPPRRGLIGLQIACENVAALLERVEALGYEILGTTPIGDHATIKTPHGGLVLLSDAPYWRQDGIFRDTKAPRLED